MNHNSHLLELEEYMYPLVDVARPNTFRNLFPYDEIPKVAFNDRTVPHHMPDQIWITDTTFRDGQQSRAPYTTEQIVTIYDYMHKLGGPKGKIRACEFFLYDEKDRKAVENGSAQARKTLNLSNPWVCVRPASLYPARTIIFSIRCI